MSVILNLCRTWKSQNRQLHVSSCTLRKHWWSLHKLSWNAARWSLAELHTVPWQQTDTKHTSFQLSQEAVNFVGHLKLLHILSYSGTGEEVRSRGLVSQLGGGIFLSSFCFWFDVFCEVINLFKLLFVFSLHNLLSSSQGYTGCLKTHKLIKISNRIKHSPFLCFSLLFGKGKAQTGLCSIMFLFLLIERKHVCHIYKDQPF